MSAQASSFSQQRAPEKLRSNYDPSVSGLEKLPVLMLAAHEVAQYLKPLIREQSLYRQV
jgi:hypothetical protein